MKLLIATKNKGKVRELTDLLTGLRLDLRSLNDFPNIPEPEETGLTFAENAVLKAKYYAARCGISALADDSGLEVAALGGAPGIFSARYAGADASDAERIRKLSDELKNEKNRTAQFVCAMVICTPNGDVKFVAEGICKGEISDVPRGKNGFGYDPIFVPEGLSETFGELSDDIKSQMSHRAVAVGKIIEYLRGFSAV